jgi:hypothetical protein
MTARNLEQHVEALYVGVLGLREPVPYQVIALFNRLVEHARSQSARDSLVHEIPLAEQQMQRDELLLWTTQLKAALRQSS